MKKNYIKILALAVSLLLVFINLFTLSACTSSSDSEFFKYSDEAVDWEISKDFKTLTNKTEGIEYEQYDTPTLPLNVLGSIYVSYDKIIKESSKGQSSSPVYQTLREDGIVWLVLDGIYYYYVTDDGRAYLDGLVNRKYDKFIVRNVDSDCYHTGKELSSKIINDLNSDLSDGINVEEIDSRFLDNYKFCYYIVSFDPRRQFCCFYGALFTNDYNDFLYVRLDSLDAKALDREGRLNFNSGEMITVTHLNKDYVLEMRKVTGSEGQTLGQYYYYEQDRIMISHLNDEPEQDMTGIVIFSSVFFWVAVFVVGFVFPLPFFVLGCALAFIKKLGRPKYWLWVAAFALLWMLFAALFSLIIILIILI